MPGDYTPKLAAAKAKLQAKGTAMVYVAERKSGMPTPGGGSTSEEIRTEFYGVRLNPSAEEVTMGVFGATDSIILAPGDCTGGVPDTTDYIEFDGKEWQITKIKTVAPTELALVYKFAVKER